MNKKILSFAFIIVLSLSLLFTFYTQEQAPLLEVEQENTIQDTDLKEQKNLGNKIVLLHTNDVHVAIDDFIGYAGLKAYKNQVEKEYGAQNVVLIDAGDILQGSVVGSLTKGEAAIKLMNAVAYDYFIPGNHDFDYGLPRLLELVNKLEAKTISSNISKDNEALFTAYDMQRYNDTDIAYIGITTPETLYKSDPTFFQDKEGNYIYSFAEGNNGQDLYENVQEVIDKTILEGAEYIVAIGHLGTDAVSAPWRSTDLIANTEGIDILIDAHSHSIIEGEVYKNKLGEDVLLTQAHEKLKRIGQIIIDPSTDTITISHIGAQSPYTQKDEKVQTMVDTINMQVKPLTEKIIATSDFDLVRNGESGILIYRQETNLTNLIADAYREVLDSDIAIVNAGAIREDIDMGEISFKEVLNVQPFGNYIMSIEVTGEMLKNALEHGARNAPNEESSLLHVSGLSYEIDTALPSSVKLDDKGNFIDVLGEYRVKNIKIGAEALDLNKKYVLASNNYMLINAGDGMTMFKNAKIIKNNFMLDSDLLAKYFKENLEGKIPSKYANSEGRLVIFD